MRVASRARPSLTERRRAADDGRIELARPRAVPRVTRGTERLAAHAAGVRNGDRDVSGMAPRARGRLAPAVAAPAPRPPRGAGGGAPPPLPRTAAPGGPRASPPGPAGRGPGRG